MFQSDLPSRLGFRFASRWRNLRFHFSKASWPDLYAYEQQRSGRKHLPWLDLLHASWHHGASFEDYYLLRFFDKTRAQRREYLTTSLYYELERQHNQLDKAMVMRDKYLFAVHFRDLLGRQSWSWPELQQLDPTSTPPKRLVIKHRFGVKGQDIHFPTAPFASWADVCEVIQSLGQSDHYLCESYLEQHPELARLNPGTVNTLRIMTWREGSNVEIWGVILRVGQGEGPDNWAQGGLGVWVGDDGRLSGEGVPKNPFMPRSSVTPTTGQPLNGFQVPYLPQARQLAIESALRLPEVRSVGWDVAISATGPCLIEGNDRWSHQFLQCVQGQASRHLADAVCDMYQVYE
ncbi:MAG: hypothetical protein CVV27_18195 [Candidatus Melainabacteria bacterium HGW-Melainabacteria-1]|nr:MAG: hypothetical protein CVV27_18195 [Candidatus Melainabacteria bacterium HGW-Melainabacteria-1]